MWQKRWIVVFLSAAACGAGQAGGGADGGRVDATPAPVSDAAAPVASRLYVTSFLGGIVAFDVDGSSGEATPVEGSPFDRDGRFYALAFAPSRRFAYAVDESGTLTTYAVGAAGDLAAIASTHLADVSPSVAIDPQGRWLYTAEGTRIEGFAIDPESGALAAIDGSPFTVAGSPLVVAVEPLGRFLYASQAFDGGLLGFALDPVSGQPVPIDGAPFAATSVRGGGLAFAADGGHVFSGGGAAAALAIDPDTGALAERPGTVVGAAGSDPYASDVAVDPAGDHVFSIANAVQRLHVFAVGTDGALDEAAGSPLDGGPAPYSIAVDPGGRFVFVGDDSGFVAGYAFDRGTGALDPLAHSPLQGLQPELTFVRRD